MELYRNGLKLTSTIGLDESRGSVNVPVRLLHNEKDEYLNYTEQIHIRYLFDNQLKEEILPTNGSGFYIPGKPLSHDGPIELAVHLINGDIELVTNELSFIVKNAPNGTTQVDPSEFTWQQLVDQYVNAKLDTFADKADMNKFKDDVNANLSNQDKKITDLQTSTQRKLDSQDTKINDFKAEVNTSLSNQTASINQSTSIQNSKITTLEGRMDTFTSLSEGSTTGDAELKDIRVGANGITYNNAGDAVRGQYSQLKEDLVDLSRLNIYEIGYKQNNSTIDTNGNLISNYYTDVLTYTIPSYMQKVKVLNRITISGEVHKLNPLMVFYDSSGALLKYINGNVEQYSKGLIEVIIPKDAKVVKVVQSNKTDDKNDLFVGFCTNIKSTLDMVINDYLDDNYLLTGGYISDIGEFVVDDNNNFWYTDYIETINGYISYKGIGPTNLSVISFYDSGKNLLSNVTGTGVDTYTNGICVVPNGTKYVRYCTLKNSSYSSLDVNDMEFLFTVFNKNEETELHGITWLAIGDSITYGDTVNGYAYPNYIANTTDVIVSKEGHSGYTMEALYNIRSQFIESCDVATVFAGTNDFNANKALGTIEDNTTDTFYGTVNLMMQYMQSTYNNAPVIFFTPIWRNYKQPGVGVTVGMVNDNGDNLKDFADVIIACGKKHGVPVVDLCNDSGIGEYNITGLTTDGVHPNARGQKMLAGIFKSVLHKYADYLD